MIYFFSKEDIKSFIEFLITNDYDRLNEKIRINYESYKAWEVEFCCFSYFILLELERISKKGVETSSLLNLIYNYIQRNNFSIEEFDLEFINLAFSYTKDNKMSLEESLIGLLEDYKKHNYGKLIRSRH